MHQTSSVSCSPVQLSHCFLSLSLSLDFAFLFFVLGLRVRLFYFVNRIAAKLPQESNGASRVQCVRIFSFFFAFFAFFFSFLFLFPSFSLVADSPRRVPRPGDDNPRASSCCHYRIIRGEHAQNPNGRAAQQLCARRLFVVVPRFFLSLSPLLLLHTLSRVSVLPSSRCVQGRQRNMKHALLNTRSATCARILQTSNASNASSVSSSQSCLSLMSQPDLYKSSAIFE